MKLIASLVLATAILAQAEVKVTVGDISDKRTTGKFFKGLDLDLKLAGPELAECKGIRVVIKEAKDDGGNGVKVQENRFNADGFNRLQKAFGGGFGEQKKEEYSIKVELENPARSAKTLNLDGVIELLNPAKDPAAVITVDLSKEKGEALTNDALKAAGVILSFKAAKPTEFGYVITDPNKKVASVEFCSADGKPLEVSSTSWSGFGGKKDVTISVKNAANGGAAAKVYLLTEKSVLSVPLKLNGVTLP